MWALNGTATTIDLGAGGIYKCLFANYTDCGAEGLVRWQFLTGVITIPAVAGLGLFRLTQRTLFGPGMVGVADKWRHGSASHYNP